MTPENKPMPPLAQKLVNALITKAHHVIAKEQHPPTVFLIKTSTEQVAPIDMEMPDYQTKMASLHHAQMVAAMIEADMSVMVSEGWTLPQELMRTTEQYSAERKKYGNNLENHPRRVEVMFISVEMTDERWMAVCPIRTIKGHRTIDDMEFMHMAGDERGALDNFLAYRRKRPA